MPHIRFYLSFPPKRGCSRALWASFTCQAQQRDKTEISFGSLNFVTQICLQSGASSRAKHGGAYFSAVRGSIKDPIAVPGQDEVQEC